MHGPPYPQTRRAALAGDPEARRDKLPLHINIPIDLQLLIARLSPLWFAILLMREEFVVERLKAILSQIESIVDYALAESYSRQALHEVLESLQRSSR
jgi:hypothetical protein